MNRFVKTALYAAAAASAALIGWRFMQGGAPQALEPHEPSANGDFEAGGGPGAGSELTKEQREQLLEELEDQLGA